MHKYHLFFRISCVALLASCAAMANAADIDAILAQFPGNDTASTFSACAALVEAGPEAIADLSTRLVPMGQGDDNAVRYALSGLAKYVMSPEGRDGQIVFVEGAVAGLERQSAPECKAFLMQQLQFAGDNTAVAPLAAYLDSKDLYNEAIMALTAIGTRDAAMALESAQDAADDSAKMNIQIALETMGPFPEEMAAQAVARSEGGVALPALLIEAQELALAGKKRKAVRLCKKLLKTHQPPVVCTELLDLLVSIEGSRAQDTLRDMMDHHSADCREAALAHAAKYLDKGSIRKWQRVQRKAELEVQEEIAAMLATVSN